LTRTDGAGVADVSVRDESGEEIAARPIPVEVADDAGADRALRALGFVRIGYWSDVEDGARECEAARL
jgi:hypothetical protein